MTKKQSDIFEAAKKLFYRFGVRRVTVEEICVEANASKMTFYKYFPGKTVLVKIVIDDYFSQGIERYKTMMLSDLSSEEKIRKTFELKLENALSLEMDFLLDLYKYPDEELKKHLDEWQLKSIDLTKSWFNEMQQSGLILKGLNFEAFMLYTNAIKNFAMNQETMALFESPTELTRIVSKLFLHGVAEREES